MKKVKNNQPITVLGASFNNVRDMIGHFLNHTPKDGVYVGADLKRYPCFDSDDYATEDRFYWNFVFATSQEELDKKLTTLKDMDSLGCNYYKLTESLHPMAYWEGDTHDSLFLTVGSDKVVG